VFLLGWQIFSECVELIITGKSSTYLDVQNEVNIIHHEE
jgi:hypothetical protein